MKNSKALIAAICAIVLIFSFAACTQQKAKTENVTQVVTNENGEAVTGENGEAITQEVEAQIVTDADGKTVTEVVTGSNGTPLTTVQNNKYVNVTQAVTVPYTAPNNKASNNTSKTKKNSNNNKGSNNKNNSDNGSKNDSKSESDSGSNNGSENQSGSGSESGSNNGSENQSGSGSESGSDTKPEEPTKPITRKIKINVTLPDLDSVEDTIIVKVDGDEVYRKAMPLDGSTFEITTKEKYKGEVKVKALRKGKDGASIVTGDVECSIKIPLDEIYVIADDED